MYLGLSDAVCGAYYACYGVLLLLHSSLSNLFRHYAEYTELAIITPLLFPELTNLCGLSIQPASVWRLLRQLKLISFRTEGWLT